MGQHFSSSKPRRMMSEDEKTISIQQVSTSHKTTIKRSRNHLWGLSFSPKRKAARKNIFGKSYRQVAGEEVSDENGATRSSTRPTDSGREEEDDYAIEDSDEQARLVRAREIAEGVDPPANFNPSASNIITDNQPTLDNLKLLFNSALSLSALSQIDLPRTVHTQIDYVHCLVPGLNRIVQATYYWGQMDRYEAERLLENKPEGTFLLRDSAQDEFLFSVSFRKYGRSLHARIEQWNHRFSFDSHDPGVFSSPTIYGLIEHYKDPSCCMFFEPMLTLPLHRNFTFSLRHMCRAVICDKLTYDSISLLTLPPSLKEYLQEYHYKQRVRVRRFDQTAPSN